MIFRFILLAGYAFEVDKPAISQAPATLTMRKAVVLQITDPPGVPDQTITQDPERTFDRVRVLAGPPARAVYLEQE